MAINKVMVVGAGIMGSGIAQTCIEHGLPTLLVDISKILTESKLDINSLSSKTNKQGMATIILSFEIKGKEELKSVIDKIRQVESVIDIERTSG